MAGCGSGTFSRNNFQVRYNVSQGSGGGGFEAKCKKPLPTEPPYIDMFRHLKVGHVHDSDTGKCKEALKYDWTLFCDKCVEVDISRSIQDSPSNEKRLADLTQEFAILKNKDLQDAIENAAEAKNVAKMQREFADDLEKRMDKFKIEDPIRYSIFEDCLNAAKLSASTEEMNYLYTLQNIEDADKEAACAKKVAEEYKARC